MYEIKRQDTTGLFIVIDTSSGKIIGRAEMPSDAINLAIEKGMPRENKSALLVEAKLIVEAEDRANSTQPAEGSPTEGVTRIPPAQRSAPSDDTATNQRSSYVVTPNGDNSIVVNNLTGEVVFTGSYQRAVTQAEELNRQSSGMYNPATTATSTPVPFSQSQSTSPNAAPGVNTGAATDDPEAGAANINPGTGARDDAETPLSAAADTKKTVSGTLNNNTRRQVTPQKNILDNFGSYTYHASVYLMSPAEYNTFVRSSKKSINGYNLLFQSAGAPNNVGGFQGALNVNNQAIAADAASGVETGVSPSTIPGANAPSAGRNPAFTDDFYLDNIKITNVMQGKGTGISHGTIDLKFTVVEPAGITLIDRLYEAVQDHSPTRGGIVNYGAAQYLMVIRWYGYDAAGNLVPGITGADPNSGLTDPNAVIEKYIPFVIKEIKWTVSGRIATYEFDTAPINQYIALGSRRGTIPYDMQLSGGTVNSILTGAGKSTTTTSSTTATTRPAAQTEVKVIGGKLVSETPAGAALIYPAFRNRAPQEAWTPVQSTAAAPKANAAPTTKPDIKTGLAKTLTEFSMSLTKGTDKLYEQFDEFEIVFAPGAEAIRDATLVLPGAKKEANQTPMGAPPTTNVQSGGNKADGKDISQKSVVAVAGQPIVQVIDFIIRNSSYITNQALTVIDAVSGQEVPNPNASGKPVNWYRVNFEAVAKEQYDNLRNDYAYKIKFIISAYTIDKYDSKYFPVGEFRGVHKSYPYWFTGQNTAILEYNEELNYYYNLLVSGSSPATSQIEVQRRKFAASLRDQVFYTYGARSEESGQGTRSRGNEVAANIADSLNTDADLARNNMKIIGDPAWIQQGSIAGGVSVAEFDGSAFLPDGTVNFTGSQIMYEVVWNRPQDYNLETGLANPNTSKTNPAISRVYLLTAVESELRQGKFEQTLIGALWRMPKPDGSNKAPNAVVSTKTSQERTGPESFAKTLRSTVTNPTPSSALARGTQQLLNPPTRLDNPTLTQLTNSQAYIAARRNGATPQAALQIARDSFAGVTTPTTTPALPAPPAKPVVSNGENVSTLDRLLNSIASQKLPAPTQGINVGPNGAPTPPQDIAQD